MDSRFRGNDAIDVAVVNATTVIPADMGTFVVSGAMFIITA